MTRGFLVTALVAGCLLPAGTALAGACRDTAVTVGDTLAEVSAKCGEPTFKDERAVTVEETDQDGSVTSTTTIIEEWTFDAGPQQLMQTYRFENNTLAEIRDIGYGRLNGVTGNTCRNGELLAVGDSVVDAYVKCGEPSEKRRKKDKVTETVEAGKKRTTAVTVVQWGYRFGSGIPAYAVRFEDGVAAEVVRETPRE